MRRALCLFAACLIGSLASTAAPPAAPALAVPILDIPHTKFVLANGLTVLVHEDHKAPIVAVNVWYHVGSKNEKPGKTGFAHLFEHLMFSGSENFNQTYLTAMGQIGATSLNGTTNNDRTSYFENVPTSMLDYTLFAESDRMGHFLGVLDQKKLDLQRGVVQNEKRQRENAPYGVTDQLIVENTYPAGHPYSWSPIGSMKDLDAASLADVQEWFRTNYGPNNVTLVLAGDITPAIAREKAEKYFGGLPPGPPLARHEAWVAKRSGTHRGTVQDRVPQARLYRVWNVPQYGTREEALLDIAAQVMGKGKTSRLYKRLVYKDQVATNASASNDSAEIGGQFDFTLTAAPGASLAALESAADEELRSFLKAGPSDAELRNAKTRILAQYVRIVERIGGFGGKSDLLARCQTYVGDASCYKRYLGWVRDASAADVRSAAADWLSDGDYVLEVQPFAPGLKAGKDVERAKVPALGKAESLKLPPMQSATLANGMKVFVAERHDAPVVDFSLMVDAGYAADSQDMPGLASLAQRMLEEGTATRGSLEIGERLEALGASFTTASNLDASFANLSTLKATMVPALEVYADLVLHPAFPQKELQRLQKERIAAIGREKVEPQSMAFRVVPALLYGKGHPYSLPFTGTGTEAAVGRMTRADLARFHDTWFKPNNATLLVVGDTTMAEVRPLLEKQFSAWKAGPVPAKTIPTAAVPDKRTVYLIDRPGALQSTIIGAQLAPPRNSPDDVGIGLVNDVFGANFASRINMNLREDKHWTYGVRSLLVPARAQRSFLSISAVQTDKTRESLQELVKEYAGIAGAKPIEAKELREMQDRATLGLPGGFETSAQLAGSYGTILEYGLPADYYDTFTRRALAVTPDEANAIAHRLVQPDRLVWVVVGDMSKVEAGVRELNLGEIQRIDADGNPLAR
jgi:zinc protease